MNLVTFGLSGISKEFGGAPCPLSRREPWKEDIWQCHCSGVKHWKSCISSPHTMLILANGPKKQLTSFRIFSHLQKEQIRVSCWVIIWLTSSLSDLIMSFVLSSGLCCGPNCNRIYYYVWLWENRRTGKSYRHTCAIGDTYRSWCVSVYRRAAWLCWWNERQ